MIFLFFMSLLLTIVNTSYGVMLSNEEAVELLMNLPPDSEFVNGFDQADLVRLRISLVVPGTKWCGPGDTANDYDDLGTNVDTDKCCRRHDSCPDIIPSGETKYNLTNNSYFTRLHCSCDETFRQCLHDVNSRTSNSIGKTFFNYIGSKCYREDYPITGCKRKVGWVIRKCLEYTYDTTKDKIYQWFDVPNY